ncbi:SRPBCC family protein [Hyalangium versicolor]|uniref:SRPBCC family protein n=1 Tax=Hyalangium versicolor TaxID=2861190 RepID=UPI001CCA9152|nr:SRPBCC domain-containing protein [Hyalangium versicolor]
MNGELELGVWFPQAPAELFQLAFGDGLVLRRWYGAPPGCHRTGGDNGAEPGEKFQVEMLDADGTPFVQEGLMYQVEEGQSLMFELKWKGGPLDGGKALATLSLHPAEGGTRFEVRQGPFTSTEMMEAHRTYWEENLKRLVRVAAGEAVPCFEEFWEESRGFIEPLGIAAYTLLAALREAGAPPEVISQTEETLYAHLPRLPEETASVLGAVLRARLKDPSI